jgi:hypothetical protein
MYFRLLTWSFLLLFPAVSSFGADQEVPVSELKELIYKNKQKVFEFKKLAMFCKKNGLKAYLFGGTAASFANYVKWDLLSQTDEQISKERLQYKLFQVIRSSQDLDMVIAKADGSPETAEDISKVQRFLDNHFPLVEPNGKSKWEARGLRTTAFNKPYLLENPDYKSAHLDSLSTGLIDITAKEKDEVVKDLMFWERSSTPFLEDISSGKIHFYFSDSYLNNSFVQSGSDIPMIPAIRALAKASHYNAEFDEESLRILGKIVNEFNPEEPLTPYAKGRLGLFTIKFFKNSSNMDYTEELAKKFKLREKLKLAFISKDQFTPGWWLSKKPLLNIKYDKCPECKTAKELGISTIAHMTESVEAFEGITASFDGKLTAFMSSELQGEMSRHGTGFYAAQGDKGSSSGKSTNSGLHIKMILEPDAMEGRDFNLIPMNDEIWIKVNSSNKVRFVYEAKSLTPAKLLDFFIDNSVPLEQMKSMVLHSGNWGELSEKEKKIFVQKSLEYLDSDNYTVPLKAIYSFPFAFQSEELVNKLAELIKTELGGDLFRLRYSRTDTFLNYLLPQPHIATHPKVKKIVQSLLDSQNDDIINGLIQNYFSKEYAESEVKTIKRVFKSMPSSSDHTFSIFMFSSDRSHLYIDLIKDLIDRNDYTTMLNFPDQVLAKLDHPRVEEFALHYMNKFESHSNGYHLKAMFKRPDILEMDTFLNRVLIGEKGQLRIDLLEFVFNNEAAIRKKTKLFKELIETIPTEHHSIYVKYVYDRNLKDLEFDMEEYKILKKAFLIEDQEERKEFIKNSHCNSLLK